MKAINKNLNIKNITVSGIDADAEKTIVMVLSRLNPNKAYLFQEKQGVRKIYALDLETMSASPVAGDHSSTINGGMVYQLGTISPVFMSKLQSGVKNHVSRMLVKESELVRSKKKIAGLSTNKGGKSEIYTSSIKTYKKQLGMLENKLANSKFIEEERIQSALKQSLLSKVRVKMNGGYHFENVPTGKYVLSGEFSTAFINGKWIEMVEYQGGAMEVVLNNDNFVSMPKNITRACPKFLESDLNDLDAPSLERFYCEVYRRSEIAHNIVMNMGKKASKSLERAIKYADLEIDALHNTAMQDVLETTTASGVSSQCISQRILLSTAYKNKTGLSPSCK